MKEVARAEELGINVIVTDHHLPLKDVDGKDMLPLAHAVLNSKKYATIITMICSAAQVLRGSWCRRFSLAGEKKK